MSPLAVSFFPTSYKLKLKVGEEGLGTRLGTTYLLRQGSIYRILGLGGGGGAVKYVNIK